MSEKVKDQTPEQRIAALEAENKSLKEQNESQKGIIEELNTEVAAKDEENSKLKKNPVYKVGKDEYELVIAKSKASYEGKVVDITAESLKEDKKLLKHCVDKGFGCLAKVEKGGDS